MTVKFSRSVSDVVCVVKVTKGYHWNSSFVIDEEEPQILRDVIIVT